MKISIFAGMVDDTDRLAAVKTAATAATEHQSHFLVLPGSSLGRGNTNGAILQELADKTGLSILAEVCHTFCFMPGKSPLGPFVQRFSTGTNAKRSRVEVVINAFVSGERIIEVRNKRIGMLLCGENNILRNLRNKGNAPQPRHPDLGWPFVYDILVNPAHDSMGQWNLLHKRFAYFSSSHRAALYCTNNKHTSWKTSLCFYRNGENIVMGDFAGADNFPKRIEKHWQLITVEV